jgi:ATP-dependent DNA helicase RecQ
METPPTDSQHTCSALETWRATVARELGVPRYTVLTDVALRRIATERPQTREELARIPGVGPRTLAKFGDTVIRQIMDQPAELANLVDGHPARL